MILGERVMVGAGAVVVQAVPDGLTVVGNPAVPMGASKT
jgi:serine acetyltransferase